MVMSSGAFGSYSKPSNAPQMTCHSTTANGSFQWSGLLPNALSPKLKMPNPDFGAYTYGNRNPRLMMLWMIANTTPFWTLLNLLKNVGRLLYATSANTRAKAMPLTQWIDW